MKQSTTERIWFQPDWLRKEKTRKRENKNKIPTPEVKKGDILQVLEGQKENKGIS